MAVVNTKSPQVTAQDAGTMANAYVAGGRLHSKSDVVAIGATDSANSTFRVVRIPSNARLSGVTLFNDALGTGGAANIGIYQTATNGGAAVSAALLASGVSLVAASTNGDGMAAVAPANRTKRLWELLGLAADPMREYDVVVTLTAAGTAGGNVGLDVRIAV